MNDLQVLTSAEKSLLTNGGSHVELLTFDTNMNIVYATDHDTIYGLEHGPTVLEMVALVIQNVWSVFFLSSDNTNLFLMNRTHNLT